MFHPVDALLRPKTIAIVGASNGVAAQAIWNLEYCFRKLYLVNPG
jgi:acyl-CoA synthetase (NDP forming)